MRVGGPPLLFALLQLRRALPASLQTTLRRVASAAHPLHSARLRASSRRRLGPAALAVSFVTSE